ncbi:MAG TPA: transcription elongation factor GreA [Saprospiraceae bacterium]|nr:transcription elongation factor GreA [Saprospiraceae bacterium]
MASYDYMIREDYERLRAKLDDLKTNGRDQAAKAIAEAREKGDLSENAEYDAAKDAQGLLELEINKLEKMLANARIMKESDVDTSKVTVLTKVTIKNLKVNREVTYQLVSESVANLKEKKLSVSSPIGKALLGKKIGDKVEVQTPGGLIPFEVVNISL